MKASRALTGALAFLAFAPIAAAQPGPSGPPPAPRPVPLTLATTPVQTPFQASEGRTIIDNDADYAALYGGTAPASPAIDFSADATTGLSRQVVVLASMGERNTGGYSIEITKVVLTPMATAGGNISVVNVFVKSKSPGPHELVPQHVTWPSAGVVFDRPNGIENSLIHFIELAPPITEWSKLDMDELSGWGFGHKLSLDSSGAVTVSDRTAAGGAGAPMSDRATPDELAAVNAAFAVAGVNNLPDTIPGMVADGTHFKLQTTGADGTLYNTQGFLGALGSEKDTVGPLLAALDKIAFRVAHPTFSKLTYELKSPGKDDKLSLRQDGRLTFVHKMNGKKTKIHGNATQQEMDILNKAFMNAGIPALDGTNVSMGSLVPSDVPVFELDALVKGKMAKVTGNTQILLKSEFRLRPVLTELNNIMLRLLDEPVNEALTGDLESDGIGKLSLTAFDPLLRQNVKYQLDQGHLADALAAAAGNTVSVRADVVGDQATVQSFEAKNASQGKVEVFTGVTVDDDTMTELQPGDTVSVKDYVYDSDGNMYFVISSHDDQGNPRDGYILASDLQVGTPSKTPGMITILTR